jgi:hypothetical protein
MLGGTLLNFKGHATSKLAVPYLPIPTCLFWVMQILVLLMRYALGDLHKMKTFVAIPTQVPTLPLAHHKFTHPIVLPLALVGTPPSPYLGSPSTNPTPTPIPTRKPTPPFYHPTRILSALGLTPRLASGDPPFLPIAFSCAKPVIINFVMQGSVQAQQELSILDRCRESCKTAVC